MTYQDTSREAWQSFLPVSAALDWQIMSALDLAGREGMIAEDVAKLTGRKIQSVTGNMTHLAERGFVVESGNFGETSSGRRSIKWRVATARDRQLGLFQRVKRSRRRTTARKGGASPAAGILRPPEGTMKAAFHVTAENARDPVAIELLKTCGVAVCVPDVDPVGLRPQLPHWTRLLAYVCFPFVPRYGSGNVWESYRRKFEPDVADHFVRTETGERVVSTSWDVWWLRPNLQAQTLKLQWIMQQCSHFDGVYLDLAAPAIAPWIWKQWEAAGADVPSEGQPEGRRVWQEAHYAALSFFIRSFRALLPDHLLVPNTWGPSYEHFAVEVEAPHRRLDSTLLARTNGIAIEKPTIQDLGFFAQVADLVGANHSIGWYGPFEQDGLVLAGDRMEKLLEDATAPEAPTSPPPTSGTDTAPSGAGVAGAAE